MKSAIAILFAMFGCTVFAADLYIGDGVNDNEYTDSSAFKGASKIIKTGTGKTTINFGDTNSGYSGEIEVREGTLAANRLVNLGVPSKITVSDGATMDLTSNGKKDGLPNTRFVIAGTGVNGGGAIRRDSGDSVNAMFGGIDLVQDALVNIVVQTGMKGDASTGSTVNLNGNTLSVGGGGVFYCPNTQFVDSNSGKNGGIHILAGTFFPRYGALSSGSKENVLTLSAGAVLRLRELSASPKWTLRTVKSSAGGSVTIEGDEYKSTDLPDVHNVWAGNVELGVQLTMKPSKVKSHFTVAGNITGGKTLAIANGDGTGKVSGTNEVSQITVRSGTMFIGGGKTTVSGILDQTGGTLAVSNAVLHWSSSETKDLKLGGSNPCVLSVLKDGVMYGEELAESGASARLFAGKEAQELGIVKVHEGAIVSNVNLSLGVSGCGALHQTGGRIEWPLGAANDNSVAVNAGSYAYFGIGGEFSIRCGESAEAGARFGENGTAVIAVKGKGSFAIDNTKTGKINFASGDTGSVVWYQDGGAKSQVTGYLDFGDVGDRAHTGTAVLTVSGAGSELVVPSEGKDTSGIRMLWTKTGACGIVNVTDGGTISSPRMYKVSSNAKWYLNVDGGVLRLNRGGVYTYESADARLPDKAVVYERGLAIDASVDADMPISFEKPSEGKRILNISLPTDDAFKAEASRIVGPPVVKIDGDGQGATAVALFDDATGSVTNIAVTSSGWGYTQATATLSGGGLAGSYSCAVALEEQPSSGWKGLSKRGAGKLFMYGANTFKGDVTVEEGTLVFKNANAAQSGMPEGAGITLKGEGSIISFYQLNTQVAVPFFAGCGQANNGIFTVTDRIECRAEDVFSGRHLRFLQRLVLSEGVKIVVTDPENLVKYANASKMNVVEAAKGVTCNGTVSLVFAGDDATQYIGKWVLEVKDKSIALKPRKGMVIVVR